MSRDTEEIIQDLSFGHGETRIVGEAIERLEELEGLLDHYRGTCDECGREGVLLEAHPDSYYDEPELYHACWTDPEECARIVRERAEAAASKRQETARRGWETRRAKLRELIRTEYTPVYFREQE